MGVWLKMVKLSRALWSEDGRVAVVFQGVAKRWF